MNSLLEEIRIRNSDTRATAMETYRALLDRRNDPQPGDADALADVMATLRLTEADVQADSHALSDLAEIGRSVLDETALGTKRDELELARQTYDHGMRDLLKKMIDGLETLQLWNITQLLLPAVRGGYPPERDALTTAMNGAEAEHRSMIGLQEHYKNQIDKILREHPRIV